MIAAMTQPTRAPEVVASVERATLLFAAHKPGVLEALGSAITQNPHDVTALAFEGLVQVLLARRETMDKAGNRLQQAQAAMRQQPATTPVQAALVKALRLAVAGRLCDAASVIEAHLADDPDNLLCFKLVHLLRFMAGDAHGMLAMSSNLLPRLRHGAAVHGYLLGCHAFGLGEAGRLTEADMAGRQALELAPDDAWGLHAVAHVAEARKQTRVGLDWLEKTRPVWSNCNNFKYHMGWHLALLQLSSGDAESALRIYDAEVRPQATDDFRDVANAASLLWRLALRGVAVGTRWDELHALARRRRDDATLVFATLHHLLSCLAKGDRRAAREIAANLERLAATGDGDQAKVARYAGAPLAKVLADFEAGEPILCNFKALAAELPRLGGSHLQRDVFVQTLARIEATQFNNFAVARPA